MKTLPTSPLPLSPRSARPYCKWITQCFGPGITPFLKGTSRIKQHNIFKSIISFRLNSSMISRRPSKKSIIYLKKSISIRQPSHILGQMPTKFTIRISWRLSSSSTKHRKLFTIEERPRKSMVRLSSKDRESFTLHQGLTITETSTRISFTKSVSTFTLIRITTSALGRRTVPMDMVSSITMKESSTRENGSMI